MTDIAANDNSKGESGCLIFFLVFMFAGFGLVLTVMGARQVLNYFDSNDWESTSGEIIRSQLGITTDSDGDTYRPEVAYEYVVNDIRYINDRLRFDGGIYSSNRDNAARKVAQYEMGMTVSVFYDPTDPQEAVLERNLTTGIQTYLGVGIILLAIGIFLIIYYFRHQGS